jgi:hypothetical protein
MEKIIWYDITDSQKNEVLERARTYLLQQKAEAKQERRP